MEDVYSYMPEELEEFRALTAGLPDTKIGLGAHSLLAISCIIKITEPTNILEIGFDRGHSAAMWLGLSKAKITSIDISTDPDLFRSLEVLNERYPGRITFMCCNSRVAGLMIVDKPGFDLAFIDGDHSEEGAYNDMMLAKNLGIKWVVLDDWLPQYGPGVQAAAKRCGLRVVATYKNIVLGCFR